MDIAAELQTVVTNIQALGLTASTDPSQVTPPGVVVQLNSIDKATLSGRELDLQLLLVVGSPDGGPGPAAALSALLAQVETWATADGPILARSVVLPSNPSTPLPGLLFPLTVRTDA
jgi:hypothetical protein